MKFSDKDTIEGVEFNSATFIGGASLHGREPSAAEVLEASIQTVEALLSEDVFTRKVALQLIDGFATSLASIMTLMDKHDQLKGQPLNG